jgi:hypothetical protein
MRLIKYLKKEILILSSIHFINWRNDGKFRKLHFTLNYVDKKLFVF